MLLAGAKLPLQVLLLVADVAHFGVPAVSAGAFWVSQPTPHLFSDSNLLPCPAFNPFCNCEDAVGCVCFHSLIVAFPR